MAAMAGKGEKVSTSNSTSKSDCRRVVIVVVVVVVVREESSLQQYCVSTSQHTASQSVCHKKIV